MQNRVTAHLYTETKTVLRNHKYEMIYGEDGTLFSQGRHKTKLRPSDLPEWYVRGRYYKHFGYLSAKGVRHLYYRPNLFTNHMFKDDFLFISYDCEIIPNEDILQITGSDEYIYDWEIVDFLKTAEKYSGCDISNIKAEIEQKRVWFKEHFPEDYVREVGACDSIWA